MVVELLNDRVAHRRLARRGASTHAYDEGLPGPVLRLGEREPRRGDERAVAAGGAGRGGGRGEGEAARVETEAAEVGTHRGAQRVLHRLYGGGCRLAGHLGDRLGGFDTGRRWGFWVGELAWWRRPLRGGGLYEPPGPAGWHCPRGAARMGAGDARAGRGGVVEQGNMKRYILGS